MTVFDEVSVSGKPFTTLKYVGEIYLVFFLIVNMVLMLNFVIAILSSTFS